MSGGDSEAAAADGAGRAAAAVPGGAGKEEGEPGATAADAGAGKGDEPDGEVAGPLRDGEAGAAEDGGEPADGQHGGEPDAAAGAAAADDGNGKEEGEPASPRDGKDGGEPDAAAGADGVGEEGEPDGKDGGEPDAAACAGEDGGRKEEDPTRAETAGGKDGGEPAGHAARRDNPLAVTPRSAPADVPPEQRPKGGGLWRWLRGAPSAAGSDTPEPTPRHTPKQRPASVDSLPAPLPRGVLHGGCLPGGGVLNEGYRVPPDTEGAAARKFVGRAFQQLVALCTSRKHSQLKRDVQTALTDLETPPDDVCDSVAGWVAVLKQACDTQHPPIVLVALDSLQKLLSFALIKDSIPGSMPAFALARRIDAPPPPEESAKAPVGLLTEVVAIAAGLPHFLSLGNDAVQLQVLKALLTVCTVCRATGWALRASVRTIFTLTIRATAQVNSSLARTVFAQTLNSVFGRQAEVTAAGGAVLEVWQEDAAWIFCHLAGVVQDTAVAETMAQDHTSLRFVTSALTVMQQLLRVGGTAVQHPGFLHRVRGPLLTTVLRCFASPLQPMQNAGLDLFVELVCKYKHLLKAEVGRVFTGAILRPLQRRGQPPSQRYAALDALRRIAEDPQVLLDIYVNYDCEMGTESVFQPMVSTLCALVQSPPKAYEAREQEVQRSLDVIVTMLRSVVSWMKRTESSSVVPLPGASLGAVERSRERKAQMQCAVGLFNSRPNKGVQEMVRGGLLARDPKAVAELLRECDALDRGMVGEYLGDPDEFNSMVLVRYCEGAGLEGVSVDEAVRKFLGTFTLPKEGQRIERIMEQLAEVWHALNPGSGIRTSEGVFLIVVGMVMLNTDLHNPQVERKMSLERWVSQFRGANGGEDFDTEMLESIYSGIQTSPMKSLAVGGGGERAADGGGQWLRSLFTGRRDRHPPPHHHHLVRVQDIVDGPGGGPTSYLVAENTEHVKPLFSACWAGVLAGLSVTLQNEDAADIARSCVEGLRHGLYIAAVFEMDTVREAFVNTLCKAAHVGDGKAMAEKSLVALSSLLEFAREQGDCLCKSWRPVLLLLSSLEQLRAVGDGVEAGSVDAENWKMVSATVEGGAVSRILDSSVRMSQVGVKDFVRELCDVALSEVLASPPQTFALCSVIAVSMDNVGLRLLGFWKEVSQLLTAISSCRDDSMAEYAVDSLRRLVMRCVQHPGLVACGVQPELMQPFLRIMQSEAPSQTVRDLVLRCVTQLVVAQAPQIDSAWPTLFETIVAGVSAKPERAVAGGAMAALRAVFKEEALPHVVERYHGGLVDAACVVMGTSERMVAEPLLELLAGLPNCGAVSQEASFSVWMRSIEALVFMTTDRNATLRLLAVDMLHRGAVGCGAGWPEEVWAAWCDTVLVAAAVLPLSEYDSLCRSQPFTHMRVLSQQRAPQRVAREEWAQTTLPLVVSKLVVAPAAAHARTSAALRHRLPGIVAVLVKVAADPSAEVQEAALTGLNELLCSAGPLLSSDQWGAVVGHLCFVVRMSHVPPASIASFASGDVDVPAEQDVPEQVPSADAAADPDVDAARQLFGSPRSGRKASDSYAASLLLHSDASSSVGSVMGRGSAEEAAAADSLARRAARLRLLVAAARTVLHPDAGAASAAWHGADPALRPRDVAALLSGLRSAAASASFFFSAPLAGWRRELVLQYPDVLRLVGSSWRGCAALRAEVVLSSKTAGTAEARALGDELHVDTAALLLQFEEACEDAGRAGTDDSSCATAASVLAPVAAAVLDRLCEVDSEEFKGLLPSVYPPVCRTIRLGSELYRSSAAGFLLRVGREMGWSHEQRCALSE